MTGDWELAGKIVDLERQRDALLAAAERVLDGLDGWVRTADSFALPRGLGIAELRAAVALARGTNQQGERA